MSILQNTNEYAILAHTNKLRESKDNKSLIGVYEGDTTLSMSHSEKLSDLDRLMLSKVHDNSYTISLLFHMCTNHVLGDTKSDLTVSGLGYSVTMCNDEATIKMNPATINVVEETLINILSEGCLANSWVLTKIITSDCPQNDEHVEARAMLTNSLSNGALIPTGSDDRKITLMRNSILNIKALYNINKIALHLMLAKYSGVCNFESCGLQIVYQHGHCEILITGTTEEIEGTLIAIDVARLSVYPELKDINISAITVNPAVECESTLASQVEYVFVRSKVEGKSHEEDSDIIARESIFNQYGLMSNNNTFSGTIMLDDMFGQPSVGYTLKDGVLEVDTLVSCDAAAILTELIKEFAEVVTILGYSGNTNEG